MEVLGRITNTVDWYKSIPADFIDVNMLLHKRKMLASEMFELSVEAGKARKDWKDAERNYSVKRNQYCKKWESKGVTKADVYAKANTEEEHYEMNQSESIFYSIDYVIRAVKEVLADMNQKIAWLRQERENSKVT